MSALGTEIQTIIEASGLLYYRSVNINDLNEAVGNTDLTPMLGVYTSLPSVDALTFPSTNKVVENTTIEVYFLALNNGTDETGAQIEAILDTLEPYALEFVDNIMKSKLLALSYTVEGYKRDALETLKMTKEVLTGWRVEMILPIDRTKYYCPVSPIDPDAQLVIDQMVGPTQTQIDAINDFVIAEKLSGNWALMDDFACGSLGDVTASNGLLKWKSLNQMVANGGLTIDLNGWNFNGTNAFVDSGYNGFNDGVKYQLNDGSISVFIINIGSSTACIYWGSYDGGNSNQFIRETSTRYYSWLNNKKSTTLNVAPIGSTLYNASVNATELKTYLSGVLSTTIGVTGGGVSNINEFIGARNNQGTSDLPTDAVITTWSIGAAIGFDHVTHNTNVRNLLTSLGVTL